MPCVTWNYSAALGASCSGEKGQEGASPLPCLGPSFIEGPIIGDKSHLSCNSLCLGAGRAWLQHALAVLWEPPGQEEVLMGASTPEGPAEVHGIYKGPKCMEFIQGSRESSGPGVLRSEAQIQGAGWDVPVSEPGVAGASSLSFALSTLPVMRTRTDPCGCGGSCTGRDVEVQGRRAAAGLSTASAGVPMAACTMSCSTPGHIGSVTKPPPQLGSAAFTPAL